MKHQILIGIDRESIEKEITDSGGFPIICDVLDFETVRVMVTRFMDYSADCDVLLVNAAGFNTRFFSIFLKLLEYQGVDGSVWFYGKPLSEYPFTIRSRCRLYVSAHLGVDSFRQYCKQKGTLQFYPSILLFQHYGVDVAWEMRQHLEGFVDLLYLLDTTKTFSVYCSQVKEVPRYYIYLFHEWLDRSDAFTNKQLSVCSFLRHSRFIQMAGDVTRIYQPESVLAKLLFEFMFAYKSIST